MGQQQVLTPRVKVALGVMAMKRYSTLSKAPELEPQHLISIISWTLIGEIGVFYISIQLGLDFI